MEYLITEVKWLSLTLCPNHIVQLIEPKGKQLTQLAFKTLAIVLLQY
uniref:Uncharacterized protein n=1 Tax=Rhizophora mucronata TaxID=61149 RepID=A0A2P2NTB2_RHIMU